MKKTKVVMILGLILCITTVVNATRFGGLYGTDSGNTRPPVAAFLNTIDNYPGHTRTGPMAHYVSNWDSANNATNTGVDDFEFTYTCEHGSPWAVATNSGICDFNSYGFGGSSNQGWGDDRCNWIVIYACQVICSPIEVTDWWSVWISNNPNDVMDGAHMIMGFHTNAYVSPAVSVSTHFADYICTGEKILYKWFHSVWYYSYLQTSDYDRACAVFWLSCKNDTLENYAPDPPAPGDVFMCWYY